jgi:hypothetical protein
VLDAQHLSGLEDARKSPQNHWPHSPQTVDVAPLSPLAIVRG